MSEKLYEALEVCLNALETGADLGSVLKRFPDLEDELAPILEASQQARLLAIPEVPEKAYQRGIMRVLQHANAMRNPVTKPRQRWAMFSFPRLAASLAVAFVLMLSGTGLVRAADTALPGDNLYSVKRTWEDVRLVLSFDPEIRGELEDEFEDERLHEIDELLGEGRHESISFAGVVTEQNGDQWVVSGISVQITPDSHLPVGTVSVGDSIAVEGRTNAQGFVEAGRVELLGSNLSLPRFAPTEIEGPEEDNHNGNSGSEIDESHQDDLKIQTTVDDEDIREEIRRHDKSDSDIHKGSGDDENDKNKDSDSEDDSGQNSNDDNSHDNDNESHDDNSNSSGGGDDNDNGNEH